LMRFDRCSKEIVLEAISSDECIFCDHTAGRNLKAPVAVAARPPVQPDLN
uniref:Transcriptional regulator n=1 Tax=Echinostoma caproni TaxID=27848 RepID=A0A183BDZ6_9TREM